ncbi:MAG: hypothetical protein P8169_15225, partial [Chloroflexota bacterium]
MKTLGPDNFARARAYLLNEARPLERSLFRYHFEDRTAVAVWQELAAFQNGDGGFGHALEPDVRTPTSSALATGIALRILAEIGAPPEHPMAQDAVGYLKKTLD